MRYGFGLRDSSVRAEWMVQAVLSSPPALEQVPAVPRTVGNSYAVFLRMLLPPPKGLCLTKTGLKGPWRLRQCRRSGGKGFELEGPCLPQAET